MRARVKALLPIAAAGVLGVVAAVLALVGQEEAALALVALLVTLVAVVAVDVWHRTRDSQHMQRLAAERQHAIAGRLGAFLDDESLDSDGVERTGNNLVHRLEAIERRVVAALESERLRSADERAELLAEVAEIRDATRQAG
ncbi:MAG: hypothetical protein NVV70_07785 [Cellulomonas sp.]|uniref:Uncharacterized protein n=1 Tax=Cellulomonas gelida TaxID=1712 RepID=A0A4Y3KKR7_9CELL|nr:MULTISPECIES: hypothetical protein [Cellulomonas]KMM44499.1 hypothetical protein CWIS_15690 [Cellulomonas sp. A375-1]MCR6648028.1 hypothetical protein [Cellulomonas sp.]GEA83530.1 hypothetical protein CGE01nite_07810 [Cellulomonas gelida]GGL24222.1 hypothetical protein GCM10009774_13380 [Cellulomonas gelida]